MPRRPSDPPPSEAAIPIPISPNIYYATIIIIMKHTGDRKSNRCVVPQTIIARVAAFSTLAAGTDGIHGHIHTNCPDIKVMRLNCPRGTLEIRARPPCSRQSAVSSCIFIDERRARRMAFGAMRESLFQCSNTKSHF